MLQINLRLILVSGKTKEFLFSPSDSAGEIAKTVFEQWPEGEYTTTASESIDCLMKFISILLSQQQIGRAKQLIKLKS